MRTALVLTLLFVLAVHSSDAAWGRSLWRRVKEAAKHYAIVKAIAYAAPFVGKRSASDLDENMDGVVDQTEMESVLNTRDAEQFLQLADDNGDEEVSLEEFERAARKFSST